MNMQELSSRVRSNLDAVKKRRSEFELRVKHTEPLVGCLVNNRFVYDICAASVPPAPINSPKEGVCLLLPLEEFGIICYSPLSSSDSINKRKELLKNEALSHGILFEKLEELWAKLLSSISAARHGFPLFFDAVEKIMAELESICSINNKEILSGSATMADAKCDPICAMDETARLALLLLNGAPPTILDSARPDASLLVKYISESDSEGQVHALSCLLACRHPKQYLHEIFKKDSVFSDEQLDAALAFLVTMSQKKDNAFCLAKDILDTIEISESRLDRTCVSRFSNIDYLLLKLQSIMLHKNNAETTSKIKRQADLVVKEIYLADFSLEREHAETSDALRAAMEKLKEIQSNLHDAFNRTLISSPEYAEAQEAMHSIYSMLGNRLSHELRKQAGRALNKFEALKRRFEDC